MRCRSVFLVMIVCTLSLVAVDLRGETIWDTITRAFKEAEEHRAFCAENPKHDRCKEPDASTALIWCESNLPENLGRCHGVLQGYAIRGATEVVEWKCVPQAVVENTEQLRRLFIREAHRVPEVLHLPASQLLYYAVTKAFPCPLRAR
jgi:hypothetical protein